LKKVENGVTTYYLRSTVLGQQVAAELNASGQWTRGFVYLGGTLLAIQDVPQNRVLWTHQEPFAKSQRITDSTGAIVAGVELEPFGLETNRSFDNAGANQRRQFTTYDRDANNSDEAMFRRYNRWNDRFDQPDPSDGSASLGDPQSLNRYAYTQGDPVNFVDPTGLELCWEAWCGWGGSFTTTSLSGTFALFDRMRNHAGFGAIIEAWADYNWWLQEAVAGPVGELNDFEFLFGISAWSSFFGGGGGSEQDLDQALPLPRYHCLSNVIKAAKDAFQRAGLGTLRTEAGFVAYRGTDGKLGTANLPNTNQDKAISFKISEIIPAGATAVAIFHTHPTSGSSATPSSGDRAAADNINLPIYVISSRGLNVYDPSTKQTTEVRSNLDWQKPCK
jgi:RHS repeat-associated protein